MSGKTVSRIPITFIIQDLGKAKGELIRFLAPRTVDSIIRNLPLEGRASLWKEEVRFEIPIRIGEEKAKITVVKGSIAYWPLGNALCVFYGVTQPYSPVNIVGRITDNLELFRQVKSGTRIKMEKAENSV